MRHAALAALVVVVTLTAAAPVAHASAPSPQIAHCVDIGPVYVLGQLVFGTYEICVPV